MTDKLDLTRHFTACAAFLTLPVAFSQAQTPQLDDVTTAKHSMYQTAPETKARQFGLYRDVLMQERVHTVEDLNVMKKRFVDQADAQNIFLDKVKAPYQGKISHYKKTRNAKALNKVYTAIDKAERQEAARYFNKATAFASQNPSILRSAEQVALNASLLPEPDTAIIAMGDVPEPPAIAAAKTPKPKETKDAKPAAPIPVIPAPPITNRQALPDALPADVNATLAPQLAIDQNRVPLNVQFSHLKIVNPNRQNRYYERNRVVFDSRDRRREKLDYGYLENLAWQMPMPRNLVRTHEDSVAYVHMSMKKFADESGLKPAVVNTSAGTNTAGLFQLHPRQTQPGLERQLHMRYPKGAAAKTESGIRTQLVFNAKFDENSANALFRREDKRRREGRRPLIGQTCLVNRPLGNGKGVEYVPITLSAMSIVSAMQAGPGILNMFYNTMDNHYANPTNRKTNKPVVFNKTFYKQNFNKFMAHAPQDLVHAAHHQDVARYFRNQGYRVGSATYMDGGHGMPPVMERTTIYMSQSQPVPRGVSPYRMTYPGYSANRTSPQVNLHNQQASLNDAYKQMARNLTRDLHQKRGPRLNAHNASSPNAIAFNTTNREATIRPTYADARQPKGYVVN